MAFFTLVSLFLSPIYLLNTSSLRRRMDTPYIVCNREFSRVFAVKAGILHAVCTISCSITDVTVVFDHLFLGTSPLCEGWVQLLLETTLDQPYSCITLGGGNDHNRSIPFTTITPLCLVLVWWEPFYQHRLHMYEKIKKIAITCNCSFKVTFISLFKNGINKDYIILCKCSENYYFTDFYRTFLKQIFVLNIECFFYFQYWLFKLLLCFSLEKSIGNVCSKMLSLMQRYDLETRFLCPKFHSIVATFPS